jgi:hypothetical protein
MPVYNALVSVAALIVADSPEEATQKLVKYVEREAPAVFVYASPENTDQSTFESDDPAARQFALDLND